MSFIFIIVTLLTVTLFTSCADTDTEYFLFNDIRDASGFWSGLWHGLILPISWIGSLFSDDIAIYAYNNTGGWYDFGFVLGVSGLGASNRLY